MQRTAGGLDYRVRFIVPNLQPIDELEPASCTWKCLAAEALGGHAAVLPAFCVCSATAAPGWNARNASQKEARHQWPMQTPPVPYANADPTRAGDVSIHRNPNVARSHSRSPGLCRVSHLPMATFLLSANALAFQVGTPSVVNHRVSCAAPAVTMAIPWRIAGAVTVAGGAAAGATFAVKAVLKKQATNQAEDSRKTLAAMGGMDLPSGDLLDKEVEDPYVILGSDHGLNAGADAATEAEPTLALASQAIGRRSPPSPAARGMRALSPARGSGGHLTRWPSWRRRRPRSEALASDCRDCQSGLHAHGYFFN